MSTYQNIVAFSDMMAARRREQDPDGKQLAEENARRWFRSEALRVQRGLKLAISSKIDEPCSYGQGAGWHLKGSELCLWATAAERGRISWAEAKARFEGEDLAAKTIGEEIDELLKTYPRPVL